MAQFTLSTINARGETILTRYDAVTGETAGLTFDESLNTSIDGNTLSFSMLKYHYEGSQKVVNTAATALIYGSQIKLLTNGQTFLFNVESIKYTFLQDNLQLDFSCIDSFQYELSKLGIGYTIEQDTTDPNYEGAQSIDYWARKIVKETGVRWSYIAIDEANADLIRQFNSPQLIQELRDDPNSLGIWTEYQINWSAAPKFTEISFNWPVSFTCSNSTAYTALKQLGTENELVLRYNPADLTFWFVPQKNPWFKGYYFNPNNNLQAFSLSGAAQNLVTVLNVQGPKDYNDQEVLLVPSFPNNVVSYIQTPAWETSVYYTNLYIDNCATEEDKDDIFYKTSAYTPWLENKLINIDYFKDSSLITQWEYNDIENILNNKLRIVNGSLIIQTAAYLQKYEEDYMTVNQKQIDAERLNANLYGDIDYIYQIMKAGPTNGVYQPIGIKYMQDASATGGYVPRIGVYNPNGIINELYYKLNNDAWKAASDYPTPYIHFDDGQSDFAYIGNYGNSSLTIGTVTLNESFNNSGWHFGAYPISKKGVGTPTTRCELYEPGNPWTIVDHLSHTAASTLTNKYVLKYPSVEMSWLVNPDYDPQDPVEHPILDSNSSQFCEVRFYVDTHKPVTIKIGPGTSTSITGPTEPEGTRINFQNPTLIRDPASLSDDPKYYIAFEYGGDLDYTFSFQITTLSCERFIQRTLTDGTTTHTMAANIHWEDN